VTVDVEYENSIGVYGEVFWDAIANNTYEIATFDFIEKRANEGSTTFIDIGSATGCMVLFASGLNMKVIGIEPQEKVFESLRRNVILNPKLIDRIEILHGLVVSGNPQDTESRSGGEFFTPGAQGPLEKKLNFQTFPLQQLLSRVDTSDKVSIKIDIEGAEYPLLSHEETLKMLHEKHATIYLSFHPGFDRPLISSPGFIKHQKWRFATFVDTYIFVRKLKKFCTINILNKKRNLSNKEILLWLIRNQKDFVLTF
jgi:FkbM family methyltransferase